MREMTAFVASEILLVAVSMTTRSQCSWRASNDGNLDKARVDCGQGTIYTMWVIVGYKSTKPK